MEETRDWPKEFHISLPKTWPYFIPDMDGSLWFQPGDAEEVFPFRPWWMANQFTKRFFRRQRRSAGIVEECCVFKGCTVSELSEYCAAT
jgi:hypothetical protein